MRRLRNAVKTTKAERFARDRGVVDAFLGTRRREARLDALLATSAKQPPELKHRLELAALPAMGAMRAATVVRAYTNAANTSFASGNSDEAAVHLANAQALLAKAAELGPLPTVLDTVQQHLEKQRDFQALQTLRAKLQECHIVGWPRSAAAPPTVKIFSLLARLLKLIDGMERLGYPHPSRELCVAARSLFCDTIDTAVLEYVNPQDKVFAETLQRALALQTGQLLMQGYRPAAPRAVEKTIVDALVAAEAEMLKSGTFKHLPAVQMPSQAWTDPDANATVRILRDLSADKDSIDAALAHLDNGSFAAANAALHRLIQRIESRGPDHPSYANLERVKAHALHAELAKILKAPRSM